MVGHLPKYMTRFVSAVGTEGIPCELCHSKHLRMAERVHSNQQIISLNFATFCKQKLLYQWNAWWSFLCGRGPKTSLFPCMSLSWLWWLALASDTRSAGRVLASLAWLSEACLHTNSPRSTEMAVELWQSIFYEEKCICHVGFQSNTVKAGVPHREKRPCGHPAGLVVVEGLLIEQRGLSSSSLILEELFSEDF